MLFRSVSQSRYKPYTPETVVGAFGLERNQQEGIFEIGRLVLRPDCNGKNFGSMLVGRSIKQLRKLTNVRAIITYADSTFHNGAVYQACNFTYCGMSAVKKDFWVNGKIQERGKTKGQEGEWKPRPQKHRYIMIFDKALSLKWSVLAYPKRNLTPLALDGAIAPDNQQVLPADVLVGEGTLPEPPRQ